MRVSSGYIEWFQLKLKNKSHASVPLSSKALQRFDFPFLISLHFLKKSIAAVSFENLNFQKRDANCGSFVEEGTTRGTTALVYLQLHISLCTGTVHVLSRVAGIHPTSLTAD
jgi:hypothetical protein